MASERNLETDKQNQVFEKSNDFIYDQYNLNTAVTTPLSGGPTT